MQGVNILYLMIGWLLGIFSPLIVDEVKRHCQKKCYNVLRKTPVTTRLTFLNVGLGNHWLFINGVRVW